MNGRRLALAQAQRTSRRIANLQQSRGEGWYRIANSGSDGPTRVDIYDDIGGGGWFSTGVTAADFAAEMATIAGDLEVHISSPGGDVFEGIAIYNTLAARPGNVTTVVDGLAASIASVIAQAGKTRVISPGAMMMIHDGMALCVGNASDMRDTAGLLDQVSDNIASVYAAHSGRPDGWRDAMQAETWYSAQEAVGAGLADKLAERPATDAAAVAARFDLSLFAHVPDWLKTRGEGVSGSGGESAGDGVTEVRDAVDESAWDASKAWAAGAASDDPAAFYRGICAGEKSTGDPGTQAHWALPHHYHPGDAPNRHGVTAALGRLPGTHDLKSESAARSHLEAHQSAMGDSGSSGGHADTSGSSGGEWGPEIFETIAEALKGAAR